jgi:hypothetical protein
MAWFSIENEGKRDGGPWCAFSAGGLVADLNGFDETVAERCRCAGISGLAC